MIVNKIELNHFNIDTDSFLVKKDDYLIVKNLPYKDKRDFIKSLLAQEGTINSQIVINISLLLKKNKTLTKELFEREDIFFNNYIELLDVKQDLKKELDAFRKDIITIYRSVTKSISILNQEESYSICNLKYLVMHLLTLEDISVISQLVRENIPEEDVLIVDHATSIMHQILENSGYVKVAEVSE